MSALEKKMNVLENRMRVWQKQTSVLQKHVKKDMSARGKRKNVFTKLTSVVERRDRCRANLAHIRPSSPDYGLGSQVEVYKTW